MQPLDLNLLRLFDILMEVRSVTRAADRLNLTQSAVSHALGRLRDQLGDPLFVRHRGNLRPTRRAEEIASSIREGLNLLREAVSEPEFQPATSTRSFTISASSYFCATILPLVIERARSEAPLVQFTIIPAVVDLMAEFEAGTLDFVLGAFDRYPTYLTQTRLFADRLVWIGRVGSGKTDFDNRPRLNIAQPLIPGAEPSPGRDQSIAFVKTSSFWKGEAPINTYDVLTAGMLIAGSDLITLWPSHLAARITPRSGVEILGNSDLEPFETSMLWPRRLTSDGAHSWLRQLLIDAGAQIEDRSSMGPQARD